MIKTNPKAMKWDSHGQIQFTVNGTNMWITASKVDAHARLIFMQQECHRPSSAMACATGWPVLLVQYRNRGRWELAHSAVAPNSTTALDIEGKTSREKFLARWEDLNPGRELRLQQVTAADMPRNYLTGIDYLAGDRWWWTANAPPEFVAVTAHFARLLLTNK